MCVFSEQQEKDYVDCGGVFCPFCNAESVEWWDAMTTGENGSASQEMLCLKCGKTWKEIYQMTGIRPTQPGEEVSMK